MLNRRLYYQNETFIKFKYCLYNKIVLYKINKVQQTDVEVGLSIDIYYNYRKYLIFLIILSEQHVQCCSIGLNISELINSN